MELSHVDKNGNARMVDVSTKVETLRKAVASAFVRMQPETLALYSKRQYRQGWMCLPRRALAGIMAAKRHAWS